MDNKIFKKEFCTIAKQHGFKTAFGCCYKENSECIFVLELQKSNFGDYYELNMKTYIQGVFGQKYTINKDCFKKDIGDISNRPPRHFFSIFDLEAEISDKDRLEMLDAFFNHFVIPYSEKNLSVSGIRELAKAEEILLISTVKNELDKLYPE